MGQALINSFSDRALIHGVQTGSDFAQRHAEKRATGGDVLVVAPPLQQLFVGMGFERGRMYGITGDAAMSLLFALVAQPTANGSWWSMVDLPHAGLLSAAEHGVALQRTVCVSAGTPRIWPHVVGALVDGFDLVAVKSPSCNAGEARRITARVRAQGSVLLIIGDHGSFEIDAALTTRSLQWQFDTHASSRTVRIASHGRRVHDPRHVTVCLPSSLGRVGEVSADMTTMSLVTS